MALKPWSRCAQPGCGQLTREGRCEDHKYKNKSTTRHQHCYGSRWKKLSKSYRKSNPLCVACLFKGRVKATECTDHILPHYGDEVLLWDYNNLCSLCWSCHSRKTQKERDITPNPQAGRVVVCGLPGAGKSWKARELGNAYWDADEQVNNPADIELVQHRRREWVNKHNNEPITVIVSHPFAAMELAAEIGASVHHVICDESTREKRLKTRVKA